MKPLRVCYFSSRTCQHTPPGSRKLASRPQGYLVGSLKETPGKLSSRSIAQISIHQLFRLDTVIVSMSLWAKSASSSSCKRNLALPLRSRTYPLLSHTSSNPSLEKNCRLREKSFPLGIHGAREIVVAHFILIGSVGCPLTVIYPASLGQVAADAQELLRPMPALAGSSSLSGRLARHTSE